MTKKTQTERILRQLKNGRTLTSRQALNQGIQRLRSRIFDLRESGINIKSIPTVNADGHYAVKYSLATR